MPVIIPAAPPGVELESWVLDGLALNDGSTLTLESINDPPASKRPEWISGADSDGALLAREPKLDNAIVEMKVRVAQQATFDAAVAHVGSILDKLQECERNANGLALVWDPAGSTADALTARCLMGEIVDLPKSWEGDGVGWFINTPVLTIRLTRSPKWEGAEYQVATVTSSAPIIPLELANIPGDVPGQVRFVVTDAASQSRRYTAWGLESRWYDDTTSLIIDSAAMVTGGGYAGTATADAAAYGGASIAAVLSTRTQAICGLGNLSHVGSFRPQLRFWAAYTTRIKLRLAFQALDGRTHTLSYKTPVIAVGWNHLDLGLITIPEATQGAQRWTGRIEAYGTEGGEAILIDAVWLMPAEQYGRATATYAYQPGVSVGDDNFDSLPTGTALNGRVAPTGGTWATSGAATDIAGTTGVYTGLDGVLVRGTTSDASHRNAVLGATNYTNVEVGLRVLKDTGFAAEQSVVARWVDASNYVRLRLQETSPSILTLTLGPIVAGAATGDQTIAIGAQTVLTWYRLQLIVFASGLAVGRLLSSDGALLAELRYAGTVTAAAGALATGKPGFSDKNASASPCLRFYDSFYAMTPPAEPIVCHSGQSIEFASDGVLREDSMGTYAGAPPEYIGAYPTLPNAGGPGRKTRLAVIARRNDVAMAADNDVSGTSMDSTTVTAFVTPRYLAIPRA